MRYWYITSAGTVGEREDTGTWADNALKEAGNYFTDRSRCEYFAGKMRAIYRLFNIIG